MAEKASFTKQMRIKTNLNESKIVSQKVDSFKIK